MQRSATGSNFISIGNIVAKGESSVIVNYAFTDITPIKGNNFYRLKQVDKDGKFVYSNIILLKLLQQKASLLVYPNPTADILNIKLTNLSANSKIQISIYDGLGKLITNKSYLNDTNGIQISVTTLARGMYTLLINDNNEISTLKFLKQ